ncbi:small multi-drug export protein [Zeaxanthinibacter sp. PT1]|uniref:COG2426 family protein n=1 Tax=Zeaxanthinibacter TaxID=561554 RepID=UPI00234BF028|nr:small multi-drug export protein [Zeaxanthinibacter sp. PT1]MDC6350770.1 small multi-drug export protein [Zeaxanthinibacter sp. PT1]
MLIDLLIAMLWSLSPFGEAKVGIPYGLLNGLNPFLVFIFCFLANLLVFPMMMFFLEKINGYFIRWRFYKKSALFVARRAKKGSGKNVQRFGLLGLMLFVMLPVPGTGVYAGSIATYLFKFDKQKAFWANAIGIFLSSVIVWSATLLTMKGISMPL